MSCASSLDGDLKIDTRNEASALGSAAHAAMERVVVGSHVDVDKLAERWGVDAKDLGPLVWFGRKAWEELAPSFPEPGIEREVAWDDALSLTGHIDLASDLAGTVRTLDWKTGRVDHDYYWQLAGYALCLLLGEAWEIDEVSATVVWLRDQTIETYVFRREEAGALIARIAAQFDRRPSYSVGAHCTFCPRAHSCPALAAQARKDIAILGDTKIIETSDGPKGLEGMPASEVVRLFSMSKTLAGVIESFQAAVRRKAKDGPIDGGDGTEIRLVTEKGGRVIDVEKAWPILQDRLTDSELAGVLEVRASKMDTVVAAKAGRGKGASAKKALAAELEAAGAVEQKEIVKLRVARKQSKDSDAR